MPQNSTRRSGPITSAMVRSTAAARSAFEGARVRHVVRRTAAVDRDRDAGQVARGRGQQRTRPPARTRPGRRAGAAGSPPRASACAPLEVAAGAEQLPVAVGQDPAGQEADHPYAARAALVGHVLGDAGQPGPQAVGDAEAGRSARGPRSRARARSRRRRRAPRRSPAPPGPRRGRRSRSDCRHCSSVGARPRCRAAARRPRSARRRAGRTPTARSSTSRAGVDGVAEVGGDARPRAGRRAGATASSTADPSRAETTTRAPSATRHSRGGEAEAAGGAGEDVDAVGQPEIHAPNPTAARQSTRQPATAGTDPAARRRRRVGAAARRRRSARRPRARPAPRAAAGRTAVRERGRSPSRRAASPAAGGRPPRRRTPTSSGAERRPRSTGQCRATSPARLRSSARAARRRPAVRRSRPASGAPATSAATSAAWRRASVPRERRSRDRRVAGRGGDRVQLGAQRRRPAGSAPSRSSMQRRRAVPRAQLGDQVEHLAAAPRRCACRGRARRARRRRPRARTRPGPAAAGRAGRAGPRRGCARWRTRWRRRAAAARRCGRGSR